MSAGRVGHRWRHGVFCVCGAVLLSPLAPATAVAQQASALRAHRVTLSAGAGVAGGYPIGDVSANLRSNSTGTPPPFTLFKTSSEIERTTAFDTRAGFALTRTLTIEAGGAFSNPRIVTVVSGDAEGAQATLEDSLSQYVVDAGLVWQLPAPALGRRLRPFVAGGAGYLRQLYSDRTLVETGQVYYAGGGLRYWLRGGDGRGSSLGLRADVRATWRQDGVDFAGKTRVFPTAALHLFWEP